MNFVILTELVNKREKLIQSIKCLRKATYYISLCYDGTSSIYNMPDKICQELKDIALNKCEKELENTEEQIRKLNDNI